MLSRNRRDLVPALLWVAIQSVAAGCSPSAPVVTRLDAADPAAGADTGLPRLARAFPDDSTVRRLLDEHVAREGVTGVVLGLLENGRRRVFAAGASRREGLTLDERTLFEIGSVTKVFTSLLLAEMVQRGMVRLNDPVRLYLPDSVRVPARDGREITLEDLATHVSGLPRLATNTFPTDMRNPYATYTVERLYTFLSGHALQRTPGEQYEYSNVGAALLGHALGRGAGAEYEALLTDLVLRPLGLESTAITMTSSLEPRLAPGHLPNGEPAQGWDFALPAAGGLRSSAEDILRFVAVNIDPDATQLSAAIAETQRPRAMPGYSGREMGLGWGMLRLPGRTALAHDGRTGGYWTLVVVDSEQRRGLVLLANKSQPVTGLALRLLNDGAQDADQ